MIPQNWKVECPLSKYYRDQNKKQIIQPNSNKWLRDQMVTERSYVNRAIEMSGI